MRPCNVEIFDQDFNFKYTALVDKSDFSHSEDFMDPVKNKVELPLDFIPAQLAPEDTNAPKGWYIRVIDDDHEYQGMITVFEVGDTRCKVTYSQMITLLNLNLLVRVGDISLSSIETYIKNVITSEFIDSSDPEQVIYGLTAVSTSSTTSGTLPFTDTDDELVAINILDDIVYPAFDLYSIVTDIRFDAQAKTVSINVGVNETDTRTIEADLPNVTESSFTIQKYSKQVNKVDCYDTYTTPPGRKAFYLHSDGTWDDDPDTDRILPVVNTVVTLDGWAVSKSIIDAQLASQNARLIELNNKSSITAAEYTELQTLAAKFMPPYCAAHPLSAPSIPGSDTGSIHIGTTSYSTDRYPDDYNYGAEWFDEVDSLQSRLHTLYRSYNKHILITATVSATRTRMQTVDGASTQVVNRGSFTLGSPVTDQILQSCLSQYKKSTAYETEIQNIYNSAVADAMENRAAAAFAKNKYSNLIELTMMENDAMIKPLEMGMGQEVSIIHNGVVYSSLLSGRSVQNGMATLSFGTIRLELTSYLKGRY